MCIVTENESENLKGVIICVKISVTENVHWHGKWK